MSARRRTVRVTIRGRVQGVGYRAWTIGEARARGIDGWVRNRPDGSVEAVFGGSMAAVAAMLEACRRGPALAQVTEIVEDPARPPESGPGFAQRPTG